MLIVGSSSLSATMIICKWKTGLIESEGQLKSCSFSVSIIFVLQ